jgi:hypothetical protein
MIQIMMVILPMQAALSVGIQNFTPFPYMLHVSRSDVTLH